MNSRLLKAKETGGAYVPLAVMKKTSKLYFPWISYTYADKSFKYSMDFIIATTKVCECLLDKKNNPFQDKSNFNI